MNINDISDTIHRALSSAGLNPDAGALRGVTDTIRNALGKAGLAPTRPGAPAHDTAHDTPVREAAPRKAPAAGPAAAAGTFTSQRHTGPAGSRDYKLYVPSTPAARPRPLVVMLHGCKQNPDDFAAGTRMNALAESHGFLVAYPAQAARANGSNCWNWFQTGDQQRDGGEPEILAGIVREIAATQQVDPARIFVAGLSAGAAMAVIMGETYPELFAAVGAHSGLARGAAHDVASAFAAMQGRASAGAAAKGPASGVPTIVFHGDHDTTVVPANGAAIVSRALVVTKGADKPGVQRIVNRATAADRAHTTTVHADAAGHARVEHWVIEGAGHAWSGGSAAGSYTDAKGPDASAEMVRFFLDR